MKSFSLCLSVCILVLMTAANVFPGNKEIFTKATSETVRTLDPASCYDTSCGMKIRNIYETLVQLDSESTENYLPLLTTRVPSLINGGITQGGTLYNFNIRKNVYFHNGEMLTPEDVEYSLERTMIVDQPDGPSKLLLEAVLGAGYLSTRVNGKIIPGTIKKIMEAITVDGNTVSIKLTSPFPPLLSVLQGPWASVINKKWAISKNAWDGTFEKANKLQKDGGFNKPQIGTETLKDIANGTGAYRLKQWDKSKRFVFEAFDRYWGGKPGIQTAIIEYVPGWTDLKLKLMTGDADTVSVDPVYFPEIKTMKDITIQEIPQLTASFALFNQKINPKNNNDIGSGKLDGDGISPLFFANKDIRLAFIHAIDYMVLKEDVGNGLALNPGSPNIKGLPYYKNMTMYPFDLEKSKAYLRNAFGGAIWESGFRMTIPFPENDAYYEAAALMMAENLNSLNPKIKIGVREVGRKEYLSEYQQSKYPIFFFSWSAKYPDPQNFVYTFMHSKGDFGKYSHNKNQEIDQLCEEGIITLENSRRREIYSRLQDMWKADVIGVGLYQPVSVKVYRKNISGFVANAVFDEAYELLRSLKKR